MLGQSAQLPRKVELYTVDKNLEHSFYSVFCHAYIKQAFLAESLLTLVISI